MKNRIGNPSYRNYIVSCNLNCTRRIGIGTRVVIDVNDVYCKTSFVLYLGPLVLKAVPHFSFIDKGVDRTRPASNGLNPAQVPFSLTNNQTFMMVRVSRHRGAKQGLELRLSYLHLISLLSLG